MSKWQTQIEALNAGVYDQALFQGGFYAPYSRSPTRSGTTTLVIAHFLDEERIPRDIVAFVRFLYLYTDTPWTIYESLPRFFDLDDDE